MNILEELYYGNISPNEKCFDHTSEYAKFCKIMTDNERKLADFLAALPNSENEQHMLSQMINDQSEVSSCSEIE